MHGNYDYWVSFVGHCFSIMIVATAWCSVYWIKDKLARAVAFIGISGIYVHLLTQSVSGLSVALMDNDDYAEFISRAWELESWFSIFHLGTYRLFAIVVVLTYGTYRWIELLKRKPS